MRILGSTQYGQYAFLMSTLGVLLTVTDAGIMDGMRKFVAEQADKNPDAIFGFYLRVALLVACVVAVGGVILVEVGVVSWLFGEAFVPFILPLAGVLVARQLFMTLRSALMGLGLERYSEPLQVGQKALFGIVGVLLAVLGWNVTGLLVGHFIAAVGVSIGAAWFLSGRISFHRVVQSTPDGFPRRELLSFNVLSVGLTLLMTSLYHVDILLLQPLAGSQATGYYRAALVIAEFVWFIPFALQMALLHSTSELWAAGQQERIDELASRITRYTVALTLLVALGIGVLTDAFVPLYFGEEFATATRFVLLLLPGAVGFAVARPVLAIGQGNGQLRSLVAATAIAALLNLGLNLVLIPRFGPSGAAIATSISYGSMLFMQILAARWIGFKPLCDLRIARIIMAFAVTAPILIGIVRVLPSSIIALLIVPPLGGLIYGTIAVRAGVIRFTEVKDEIARLPEPVATMVLHSIRTLDPTARHGFTSGARQLPCPQDSHLRIFLSGWNLGHHIWMATESASTDDDDVETTRWWHNWSRRQQLTYGLFCVILLIAGYLRFRRLGVAPLWIDEAYTSWAARNYLAGNGFSDPIGASSPYRRAWLTTSLPIAISFQLFGISEFMARSPMVLYSLGTVVTGWLLGNRFSRLTGLFVAAFLAMDPFTLVWAREARMYAPLAFFYLASVFVFLKWYDEGLGIRNPLPYALAALVVLGQNAHSAYLAFGAVVVIFLGIELIGDVRSLETIAIDAMETRTKITGVLFVGGVCTVAGYLLVNGVPGVLTAPTPGTWPDRGLFYYWELFGRAYPILRLVALPAGAYLWWRSSGGRLVILGLLIPLVVASITPRKAPRYIYHLVPLLGVVGLAGIASMLELTWQKVTEGADEVALSIPWQTTVYAVPILIVLIVASPVAGYAVTESVYDQPYHPGNSDWEKASDWVADHAGENAIIVSTRPELTMWYYGEADYFFRQNGVDYAKRNDGMYIHTRTGTVFLNETADIERLLDGEREVWFFAGKKFYGRFTDPDARRLVKSKFERRGKRSWVNMEVYHHDPAGMNETASS